MIKKIWIKFALLLMGIIILSFGMVTILNHYFFEKLFKSYIEDKKESRNNQITETLLNLYERDGNWSRLKEELPYFCMMLGTCVKVVNPDGKILADYCVSEDHFKNQSSMSINENFSTVIPLNLKGKLLATAYLNTQLHDDTASRGDFDFQNIMHKSIFATGVICAFLIIILSLFISQIFIKPIEQLTLAAQDMGKGNFDQAVSINSKDELGKLGEAFNQMAQKIKDLEEMRKKLTADVAHELRTPLSVIMGYVEALQDRVMEPSEENLKSIQEEVQRLALLVENLRELSLAESGKLSLSLEKINLVELLNSIDEKMKPILQEKNLKLIIHSSVESFITADRNLVNRIFLNILHNAYKYSPDNEKIEIEISADKSKVIVTVTDHGTGITKEDLPYIFERFYRADQSRARATGGTGIGLAIARELVSLHKGQIEAKSQIGAGTQITVTLPIER
ncbi:MAG: ATP-binding protein [Firmicutes bacterium]|nr:ATP-binding protein [Bacillota bacterium]